MDDFTIYGILYACPAGIRTEECLIKAIDHKTFQDKINWVDGLDEEKRKAIAASHQCCSLKRFNENK